MGGGGEVTASNQHGTQNTLTVNTDQRIVSLSPHECEGEILLVILKHSNTKGVMVFFISIVKNNKVHECRRNQSIPNFGDKKSSIEGKWKSCLTI